MNSEHGPSEQGFTLFEVLITALTVLLVVGSGMVVATRVSESQSPPDIAAQNVRHEARLANSTR